MTDFDRRKALEAALAAVDGASAELMKRFRGGAGELRAWHKTPHAPVTEADIASDSAIAAAIEAAGAPGTILSEEGEAAPAGDAPSGKDPLTWLVDPLCGTLPYRDGLTHWGINVALRDGASLELAVLAVPTAGDVFLAVRGGGVALNGARFTSGPPSVPLSEAVVCVEIDSGHWSRYGHDVARWAPAAGVINMFSSIAYPGAQLAHGRLAALVVFDVAPMHVAASAAVALELGLRVTDALGEPVDWSTNNDLPSVVIGWPDHHAALLEAIRRG